MEYKSKGIRQLLQNQKINNLAIIWNINDFDELNFRLENYVNNLTIIWNINQI